jgi:hypothetical protein
MQALLALKLHPKSRSFWIPKISLKILLSFPSKPCRYSRFWQQEGKETLETQLGTLQIQWPTCVGKITNSTEGVLKNDSKLNNHAEQIRIPLGKQCGFKFRKMDYNNSKTWIKIINQ